MAPHLADLDSHCEWGDLDVNEGAGMAEIVGVLQAGGSLGPLVGLGKICHLVGDHETRQTVDEEGHWDAGGSSFCHEC